MLPLEVYPSQDNSLYPLLYDSRNREFCRNSIKKYPQTIKFSDGSIFPLFSGGILTKEEIDTITAGIAEKIVSNFSGSLLIVQVLEGARMFCRKVCAYLDRYKGDNFCYQKAEVKISSYHEGIMAGQQQIIFPLRDENGHQLTDLRKYEAVIILDDLVDAGNTFIWLAGKYLPGFNPQVITACFLLNKKRQRSPAVENFLLANEYIYGKLVPDEWLVGFGLDIALPCPGGRDETLHLFRELPGGGIYAFNKEIERRLIAEYKLNPRLILDQLRVYVSKA